jgi:hypothetical protein
MTTTKTTAKTIKTISVTIPRGKMTEEQARDVLAQLEKALGLKPRKTIRSKFATIVTNDGSVLPVCVVSEGDPLRVRYVYLAPDGQPADNTGASIFHLYRDRINCIAWGHLLFDANKRTEDVLKRYHAARLEWDNARYLARLALEKEWVAQNPEPRPPIDEILGVFTDEERKLLNPIKPMEG